MTKTEQQLRDKLEEVLAIDARIQPGSMTPGLAAFAKVASAKTLLWALGENEDDHWYITAGPGPAVDARAKARN